MVSLLVSFPPALGNLEVCIALTFTPGGHDLDGVNDLRIEPRCHLDAHQAGKQHEVQIAQVPLLVPRDLIIHRHAMDDIVRLSTSANHFAESALSHSLHLITGMLRFGVDFVDGCSPTVLGKKELDTWQVGFQYQVPMALLRNRPFLLIPI